LFGHDETSPDRVMDGLHLKVLTERVVSDDIDERAQRRRDAHAVNRLDVFLAKP
jgi:hypothetical protein